MAKKKLKRYYGKLGFVEINSIHVPQHGLGAPFCRAVACLIILTDLRFLNWQTFGRLRFESNQAVQRKPDFSCPVTNFYGDKNDYARYEIWAGTALTR